MEKFSFYELLSFLIPGFVVIRIFEYYTVFFDLTIPFPLDDNVFNIVTMIIMSLIIGMIITFLSYKLTEIKFFKNLIYKDANKYISHTNNENIHAILPEINKSIENEGVILFKKEKIEIKPGKKAEKDAESVKLDFYPITLSFAQHYLEVEGKFDYSKRFQNFYFLFRNLFTVSIIHLLIFILLFLSSFFVHYENTLTPWQVIGILTLLVSITLIIYIITHFLRGRMINRTLWSYFMARKHQLKNKK